MRITSPYGSAPPASDAPGRANSAARPAAAKFAAPAEAAPPAEADAPAGDKAHGLVRAAGHSHRSDVAALRQWINHPDLRSELALPDLAGPHKGKGFEKALAAYQAAGAMTSPTPPAEPAPEVTDPAPVVTDPAP